MPVHPIFLTVSPSIFTPLTQPQTTRRRCSHSILLIVDDPKRRRTIPKQVQRARCCTKWNYLRRRAGKHALVRLSSWLSLVSSSALLRRCFRQPPDGVFPSSTSTSCARLDIQPHYSGLAAGWPKICQVHVALLGFPACSLAATPCCSPETSLRCQVNASLRYTFSRINRSVSSS